MTCTNRRQFLRLTGSVPLLAGVSPAGSAADGPAGESTATDPPPGGERWSTPDFDLGRSGFNDDAYAPKGRLEELWSIPEQVDYEMVAYDGTLYVMDDDKLYEYDIEEGWRTHQLGLDLVGELFVDEDYLVVTEVQDEERDRTQHRSIIVYDRESHEKLWQYDAGFHYDQKALIHGDALVVTGTENEPFGFSGDPGDLYPLENSVFCFDVETGERRWKLDSVNDDRLRSHFRSQNREILIHDDHVFTKSNENLIKIGMDGEIRDIFTYDYSLLHIVAAHGHIYASNSGADTTEMIRCIDPGDGSIAWQRPVDHTKSLFSIGDVVASADTLYYAGPQHIAALSPEGEKRWEQQFDQNLYGLFGAGDML